MNTAANHNASLTGRIEIPEPTPVYSVSEQKPAARTKPTIDRKNRLKMRLAMARQAIADLESKELTAEQRIELMKMVERLTNTRYIKPGPNNKKRGVFDS